MQVHTEKYLQDVLSARDGVSSRAIDWIENQTYIKVSLQIKKKPKFVRLTFITNIKAPREHLSRMSLLVENKKEEMGHAQDNRCIV